MSSKPKIRRRLMATNEDSADATTVTTSIVDPVGDSMGAGQGGATVLPPPGAVLPGGGYSGAGQGNYHLSWRREKLQEAKSLTLGQNSITSVISRDEAETLLQVMESKVL